MQSATFRWKAQLNPRLRRNIEGNRTDGSEPVAFNIAGRRIEVSELSRLTWDCTRRLGAGTLEREKERSLEEMSAWQVVHNDSRLANMLWNVEMGRVMIIDFERSVIGWPKRRIDV